MPAFVIVGGQYGGEGKGKVANFFSRQLNSPISVRIGGSNSGHTVVDPRTGQTIKLRHLPTSIIIPNKIGIIGRGTCIDLDVLLSEIHLIENINPTAKILIDNNAIIISSKNKYDELCNLKDRISSTASGTGMCLVDRINRNPDITFAKDLKLLKPFLYDTVSFLRDALQRNEKVIIEGTQGFGLSNIHSPDYPYVTSRDTIAASFLSEAGLSPNDIINGGVIMVIRTFPIRVGGNSGPLENEISWEVFNSITNIDKIEYTTVTNKKRRIATFDAELVKKAITINQPNILVLNHVDYQLAYLQNSKLSPSLTGKDLVRSYVLNLQSQINKTIDYLGFNDETLIRTEDYYDS